MKPVSALSIDEIRDEMIAVDGRREEIVSLMMAIDQRLTNMRGKGDAQTRKMLVNNKQDLLRELSPLRRRKRELHVGLEVMTAKRVMTHSVGVSVSDHALVRWMERKHGVNVEGMKEELATEVMASYKYDDALIGVTPRGSVRVEADGMFYVVDPRAMSVVTCYRVGETSDEK